MNEYVFEQGNKRRWYCRNYIIFIRSSCIMNKTFLLVLGFLALTASLAMKILGNKSSHLSELQQYWWIPLPLALLYFLGAEDWDVLHDNKNSAYLGSSPAQEKAGAVFKKRGKPINGWSEADREIPKQYYDWCTTWANEWLRVVKPGGSVFIFAGRRYAHRCIAALEDAGFSFKDMFSWMRQRAPHRAQRVSVVYQRRGDLSNSEKWEGWRVGNLRPTFEPVLWFTKPYKIGTTIADNVLTHGVGAFNEEAFLKYEKSPDNVLTSGFVSETGHHPTSKTH